MLHRKLPGFLLSNRFIRTCSVIIASTLFAVLNASAQQPPATMSPNNHEGWYQVEMIVFARKDDSGSEHWPSNIKLRYPADWVELRNGSTGDAKDAFYLLPANERQLNAQAQKLQRGGRTEVLFHNAWRQVITNKSRSKAIIINGGQTFGQHQSLEGSIRLSVATYLELQTNLWFTQFDLNVGQEVAQQWPALPLRPNYLATSESKLTLDTNLELDQALAKENAELIEGSSSTSDDNAYVTRKIILLKQERDMRSGEVHYIDHPVLGIVIQVTPYPPVSASAQ